MLFKNALIFILFYFLVLLQVSFLLHFNVQGPIFNLVLVSVVLINFLERAQKSSGLVGALAGGFFLDIFSGRPIGCYIIILLAVSVFLKLILKKYVRFPEFKIS